MGCRRIATALVVVLVAGASALTGCTTQSRSRNGDRVDVVGETYFPPGQRRSAPALSGSTLGGSHYALEDARGRVVVINVWASWCQECRKESRGLSRLSASLSPSLVRFVGIDEHDTNAGGRAFSTASGTTYPQLIDPRGALLARLKLLPSLGIPSTLVIDRSGHMAGRIVGAADESVLKSLIERVAAGH